MAKEKAKWGADDTNEDPPENPRKPDHTGHLPETGTQPATHSHGVKTTDKIASGSGSKPEEEKEVSVLTDPRPARPDPVPRVIRDSERAPSRDLKRYKIRALNRDVNVTKYILAEDEQSARQCYLETMHFALQDEQAKKDGVPNYAPTQLFVKELPD
jgi:hypothetical protein